MKTHLVGIAGGSASGKTTLATQLLACAGLNSAALITLDSYYRPQCHRTLEERATLNFDHPDALEFELLLHDLSQLQTGNNVVVPEYDFALHNRKHGSSQVIEPRPIVFVEGILTFAMPAICAIFDTRLFVSAPDDLRLTRRLARDVRERGRTEASVHQQWCQTVQPMYHQFCAPGLEAAHLVVDGTALTEDYVHGVWRALKERISQG